MDPDRVFYDENGNMWTFDEDSQKMKPFEVDGEIELKYDNGHYKTGVKANCRNLFFKGVPASEIAKSTGVNIYSIRKWIAGDDLNSSDPKCWNNQRQKWALEMAKQNRETIHLVDHHILGKLLTFFNSAAAPQDEKAALLFAEIRSKLMKAEMSEATGSGAKGTQVNIQNIVNPMSDQEALRIERADPIAKKPETSGSNTE